MSRLPLASEPDFAIALTPTGGLALRWWWALVDRSRPRLSRTVPNTGAAVHANQCPHEIISHGRAATRDRALAAARAAALSARAPSSPLQYEPLAADAGP